MGTEMQSTKCVWMSLDEFTKYNEWKSRQEDNTKHEPTVEELIEKVKGCFNIVQQEEGFVEGMTELYCSLKAAYLKERSFLEEECRKAGIIIEDLRKQLKEINERFEGEDSCDTCEVKMSCVRIEREYRELRNSTIDGKLNQDELLDETILKQGLDIADHLYRGEGYEAEAVDWLRMLIRSYRYILDTLGIKVVDKK